jgi:hypothetical protein
VLGVLCDSNEKIFAHHTDVGELHIEVAQADEKWRWAIFNCNGECISGGTAATLQMAQTAAEDAAGREPADWRAVQAGSLP